MRLFLSILLNFTLYLHSLIKYIDDIFFIYKNMRLPKIRVLCQNFVLFLYHLWIRFRSTSSEKHKHGSKNDQETRTRLHCSVKPKEIDYFCTSNIISFDAACHKTNTMLELSCRTNWNQLVWSCTQITLNCVQTIWKYSKTSGIQCKIYCLHYKPNMFTRAWW